MFCKEECGLPKVNKFACRHPRRNNQGLAGYREGSAGKRAADHESCIVKVETDVDNSCNVQIASNDQLAIPFEIQVARDRQIAVVAAPRISGNAQRALMGVRTTGSQRAGFA